MVPNFLTGFLLIALTPVRELEEKLRNSISSESARRESVLLMRLNSKEQEIQDLIVNSHI